MKVDDKIFMWDCSHIRYKQFGPSILQIIGVFNNRLEFINLSGKYKTFAEMTFKEHKHVVESNWELIFEGNYSFCIVTPIHLSLFGVDS